MAFQTKHRFQTFEDDDENVDSTTNDSTCEFLVCYMGSTFWSDDFTHVRDILLNIFPQSLSGKFRVKKPQQMKVFVDVGGEVVCFDEKGIRMERFELCKIKEVIYCGNNKEYSRYIILVANGQSDGEIKAHIMVCKNVKNAKKMFRAFTEVFRRFEAERTAAKHYQESNDDSANNPDEIPSSPNAYTVRACAEEFKRRNSLEKAKQEELPSTQESSVKNPTLDRSRSFPRFSFRKKRSRPRYRSLPESQVF